MIKKILIANRGEIACRIIRTAKKLGINTVAVYSAADKQAQHVLQADQAVYVGEAPSSASYLNQSAIIEAALSTGADAIHPGYGFLSENSEFAAACESHGLIFIGPSSQSIAAMGSKSAAKQIMEKAGVPLVPGYHGQDQSPQTLLEAAQKIGFPVLLKAVAGGGGRGMRPVYSADEFEQTLAEAKREAKSSFANDSMLIEKYLPRARHVEVQVFFDQHGNGIYLGDRDCSLQRRHQKVVEEAPAPGLSDSLRQAMGEAAVKAAAAIDYSGAGTVEFLLQAEDVEGVEGVEGVEDLDGLEKSEFYFMEMNTRLQVEHPVTEYVTGLDLVEWQINVANGEPLPLTQDDVTIEGHAIEVRIYAENPYENFRPDTGKITFLSFPQGIEEESNTEGNKDGNKSYCDVRVDSGFVQGDEISPYYDAMLAKVVTYSSNRKKAIYGLARALQKTKVVGLSTNIDWLKSVVIHPAFLQPSLHTSFFSEHAELLDSQMHLQRHTQPEIVVLCWLFSAAKLISERRSFSVGSPWLNLHAWRLNQVNTISAEFTINDTSFNLAGEIESVDPSAATIVARLALQDQVFLLQGAWDGHYLAGECCRELQHKSSLESSTPIQVKNTFRFPVIKSSSHLLQQSHHQKGETYCLLLDEQTIEMSLVPADHGEAEVEESSASYVAPMNARVLEVSVAKGDQVKKSQTLIVLEAMKMEYSVNAQYAGIVEEIYFKEGDLVESGAELLKFTESFESASESQ